MTRILHFVVFLAGLFVVGWVGAGYLGTNPLALAVTLLIGAVYLAGAWELYRHRKTTDALSQALAGLSQPPEALGTWLGGVPTALRDAVRLRIEGERVGLPAPSLTPYLVGLLVLLGMLGTFLGMVATLNGTGMAIVSATDLQAIRSALSAPVRGLGLAFGTSVAGVGASAMLGLLSALDRRERLDVLQRLEAQIGTTLRSHSRAHRREESLRLMRQQADAMPELLTRMQTLMTAMERQQEALGNRLMAHQQQFHDRAGAAYEGLAASVGASLRDSLAESARVAGATLQPAVEAAMAGIARETTALHTAVAQSVQSQLDGLASRVEGASAQAAAVWADALAEQQRSSQAAGADLRDAQDRLAQALAARADWLTQDAAERVATLADGLRTRWDEAIAQQQRTSDARTTEARQALDAAALAFEQRSASVVDGVAARLGDAVTRVSASWADALAQHRVTSEQLAGHAHDAFAAAGTQFGEQAAALLARVDQAHTDLQATLAARDETRLNAWTASLQTLADTQHAAWTQAGEQAAARQQALLETLSGRMGEWTVQSAAHAKQTVVDVAQLLQAAAEAPRAAAEVVAELRQKLSDSMARDNAMLDERARLLATVDTLLDAVNHASTEQRAAVDGLVATSADLLTRVGERFAQQVDAGTRQLTDVAAQVAGGGAEVASLGEAFGHAVELFSQSSDKMAGQLQRIEAALGQSLIRSDEQLAYYVAQARELIDLSLLSQKRIVDDIQRMAGQRLTLADGDA